MSTASQDGEASEALAQRGDELERVLVAQHGRFLQFLARRLGSRAEAEEVLQSAYARALERGVPDEDRAGVVAWFYRVLRNAMVDGARRRDAERRGRDRLARDQPDAVDVELRDAVCACLHDVLPALKPEYASVVREVDLHDRSLAEVAASSAITVNNATVRLHRARQALKRELLRACGACAAHGCLDCGCRPRRSPPG